MTEQTNADLIAEAQTHVTDEYITPDTSPEESLIRRLAAALKAAEQRAKNAEQRADDAREEVGYEKRMREFVSGERDRFIDLKQAAEQRADQAEATAEHLHDEDTREIVALTQERDAALAVIEKVRVKAEEWQSLDGEGPRTITRNLDGGIIESLLATAPADALREHDTALIEGMADEYADSGREQTHGVTAVLSFLYTKARQRREERS